MDRLRRMEIFVTIVEAGQFTRAASALSLSKSSVSHALSDLEKYLGLQLIKRNNRSWQLTDTGHVYYEQSKKILSDVRAMEDTARHESQRLSGHIRLSAPETFGSYTLTPIIATFMAKHPDIIIEINLTERLVDLIEERVDIAFRAGPMKDSSLVARMIGEAKMIICASPDYLEKNGEPTSHIDLKNHKCLRYSRGPTWSLMKGGRQYSFTPRDHIVTNSGETLRQFAIAGQGIGLMPTMLVQQALAKGSLVQTMTDYGGLPMPVYALRTGDNRAPARVTQLLDFIMDNIRARPDEMMGIY